MYARHSLRLGPFLVLLSACPPEPAADSEPGTSTHSAGSGATGTDSVTSSASQDPTTGSTPGSTGPGPETTANLDDTGSGDTTGADTGDASSGTSSGDTGGSSGSGAPGVCGDAIVDPGEACDDGDADESDGCLSTCELGPGAPLSPIELPPLVAGETLRCFTAIDRAQIGAEAHVLTVGGVILDHGPMGQLGGHVRAVPLPAGNPAKWTYLEYAGMYGRFPQRARTAANGDVIVAGLVHTEDVQLDSGGHLWLARFAPDGALVWNHEYTDIFVRAADMALGPDGEIIVVGPSAGFSAASYLHVFDAGGQPEWEDAEPKEPMSIYNYRGVAVDDDGKIFTSAAVGTWGSQQLTTRLRAFSPAGALLWQTDAISPFQPTTYPGGLVRAADDVLMVAAIQRDAGGLDVPALALAAYTTEGEPLWWKQWTPPAPGRITPWTLVAAPDGGLYVAGAYDDDPPQRSFAGRFDAAGDHLWSHIVPGGPGIDGLLGPDGLFHVLTPERIDVYMP